MKPDQQSSMRIKTDQLSDLLPEVEGVLENTFQAITLRPDFVTTLKSRLTDPNFIHQNRRLGFKQAILLLSALTTTILLAVGMIRLILELLSALQIVSLFSPQANQRLSQKLPE